MAQPMATFLPDLSSSRNSGMPARKARASRLGTSAGHSTAYGKCDWACEAGGAAGVRRTCGAGLVGHICLSVLRHATHNRHQPEPQQLEHTRHGAPSAPYLCWKIRRLSVGTHLRYLRVNLNLYCRLMMMQAS